VAAISHTTNLNPLRNRFDGALLRQRSAPGLRFCGKIVMGRTEVEMTLRGFRQGRDGRIAEVDRTAEAQTLGQQRLAAVATSVPILPSLPGFLISTPVSAL